MTWASVNLKPGLMRNATPYDVRDAWWDTSNVRWVSSAMQPIGGCTRLSATPFTSPTRRIFQWRDNSAANWIALGQESAVQVIFGSNTYDLTPANFKGIKDATQGGYGVDFYGTDFYGQPRGTNPIQFRTPHHWTFATYGQNLMAVCSSDGRLLTLDVTAPITPGVTTMSTVANAPISNTAVVTTSERAVMLLGAGGNARRVAWSDLENPTGWNFANPTGQAGYLDLETSTPIVTGVRVKEGVLVLTQREVFLVRYVGPPFYYGADKIGATVFYSPNALTIGANIVMWFGAESFWKYDGGAVVPVPCPFFNDITEEADMTFMPFVSHMHENGTYPEFWFEYPTSAVPGGECSRYVFWNYVEGYWGRGTRRRTAAIGATTAKYPLATGVDGNLYQHEDGWLDAGASRVGTVWAETSVLSLGDNVKDVMQALVASNPEASSTNYSLKVLSRYTPGQSETTFGPYLPRTDGYTDMRAAGRDLRLRIEATNDNYWSLGQIRIDVTSSGGWR